MSRTALCLALVLVAPTAAAAQTRPAPLTAEALAGAWTLKFTPGGENVTVKRREGETGPVLFSVRFAGGNGRLTGCTVREDSPAGEIMPARCTLQRGRLIVRLMEGGGNGMAFTLANTPGGVAGDASVKIRMLPFSPKIGTAVLTRDP